jgi:hypothetical protein
LLYSAASAAAFALGWGLFGGPGLLGVAIVALLVLVARFDNHTGSCLMVTIVLLVTIGILLSLLMVTARVGTH